MPRPVPWFTPASARCLLDRIRPTAELLYRLYLELEYRRPDRLVSDLRVDPLYFAMSSRLADGLARLEADGLKVEDLKHGMLDFPAMLDDQPVMLCWRVGEPELRFWHEPGHGRTRHPLADRSDWTVPPNGSPEPPIRLC